MYRNDAVGRNELDVNDLIIKFFKFVLAVLPLAAVLNFSGTITVPWLHFAVMAGIVGLACVVPIVYRHLRIGSAALKYINIYSSAVLLTLCYSCLGFNAIMLLLIPAGLAALYFDGRLLKHAAVLAAAGIIMGDFIRNLANWNLNLDAYGIYFRIALYVIQIVLIAVILNSVQKRANRMLFSTQSFYENMNDLFSNAYAASENLQSSEEKLLQGAGSLTAGADRPEEADTGVRSLLSSINKTVENAKEIVKYTQAMLKATGDDKNSGVPKGSDSGKIEEYSKKSKESIASLSKYTKRIKEDLSLLSVIIDESKLLSVNAAAEAENDGSGGKGSAILAMKVENLADQSAESATHIQEILDNIVSDAEITVKSIAETYEEVLKSLEMINRTVDTLIKWLMYKNMH